MPGSHALGKTKKAEGSGSLAGAGGREDHLEGHVILKEWVAAFSISSGMATSM